MVIVENILWYVGLIGLLHAVLSTLGWIVVWLYYRLRKSRLAVFHANQLVVFNCAAFLAGTVACGIWTAVTWNRWYVSMDPLVIYQPFVPFGEWLLELRWGNEKGRTLNGASVLQLQVLWLALTVGVWSSAYAATREIARRGGITAQSD